MSDHTVTDDETLRPHWSGWGSPIGLGIGLLCVGGFFVLLALGLAVLDGIN